MNITAISPQKITFSPLTFKCSNKKDCRLKLNNQPECDAFERQDVTKKDEIKIKRGQITDNGKIFTRPTTEMFRGDLDWKYFANYIQERFQGINKVNTYVYACSNGSEAYSMSILLQEKFKGGAQKFFPIIAKDIDEQRIQKNIKNQAENNIETINGTKSINDIFHLRTKEKEKYFYDWYEELQDTAALSKEKLTEQTAAPVKFSYGNILEDIKNIDSKRPSIIMCRNMWPYVDPDEYQTFANELYHRLAPGSVVVLGEYDFDGEKGRKDSDKFPKALYDAGFKNPGDFVIFNNNFIFEKNEGQNNTYSNAYSEERLDRIEQFFQRLQRGNS